MILGTEYEREKAKLRKKRGHFTTNNDRVIRKVCRVSKKSSRGRKGENGGVKREVRLWIWFLSYIMWWWTESLEKVEKDGKRRKNIWGGGEHIVFVANWCDPSEPCDSCSTLPEWPALRHTQGQLELHCEPPPHLLFLLFSFFFRQ